jgi:iron complex outermembrane receptor protein
LDKYFVKYNKDFNNNSNLLVNAYNYFDEYDYDSSPQDTNNDGTTDTYSNHSLEHKKQKGVKLEYKQESDKLAYMLGYEYGDRKYETASNTLIDYQSVIGDTVWNSLDAYAGETSQSEDNQKLHALYSELKYGFTPKLTGTFNIRHDRQTDESVNYKKVYSGTAWSNTLTNIDKTFDENSYRTGLVYNLSNSNSIFTNVATGFRTPTVDKIQANIDLGITDEIKTQTTMTYELGNRGKISDLDYEVTLFQIDTKDIIGRRWGTYSSVTNQDTTNVGDARNRGIELILKNDPKNVFSYNLAYTYLKTKYTDHLPFKYNTTTAFNTPIDIVGKELPRTPNHTLDLYATYKATENLRVISEIFARSSYYADEPNKLEMPGYAYMNLQTRYNTKIGAHNFEFFAKVNNVFDKQYFRTVYMSSDRNVAGLSPIGVINAEDLTITVDQGREYFAGVKYTF